jgi:hypothetical protein
MPSGAKFRLRNLGRFCCVALAVCDICSFAASAQQQQSAVLQGTWTASVGSGGQVFRGTWSAQASPQAANSFEGSWALLGDSGQVAVQGTWSARKSPGAWHGTWSARAAGGGSYSGTWGADLDSSAGKTLQEMLKRTFEKPVAGSWRSGRYQGFWWLSGSAPRTKAAKPR